VEEDEEEFEDGDDDGEGLTTQQVRDSKVLCETCITSSLVLYHPLQGS